MKHDNKTIDNNGFLLVKDRVPLNFTGKVKWPDGDKFWYKNGRVHREDGPAVVWADGCKEWYINDKHHREDGPAVVYQNGRTEWYYNDIEGLENFPPEAKKKLARRFLHGT